MVSCSEVVTAILPGSNNWFPEFPVPHSFPSLCCQKRIIFVCRQRFFFTPTHRSLLFLWIYCRRTDEWKLYGMGSNGPSVRLTLTVASPAPAQPRRCLITCTHKPHLSSYWFSCRSTCLPVVLSLSNKDFIVCIVVYGCPGETEYYVY